MKPPIKKKKKLPFYAKVGGSAARSRADRAAYKRGGSVSVAKADLDPISPNEPHAPAGGKVTQKFKSGGVAKRQGGGDVKMPDRPPPRQPDESSVGPMRPTGSGTYDPSTGRVKGFRTGGAVKKRQGGGDVPLPRPKPSNIDDVPSSPTEPVAWGGRLEPLEHTGPAPAERKKKSEGWDLEEDVPEFLKIEGRDYGKQPASLGEKILSTGKILAQPAGAMINRARKDLGFKDGGKLSAAQRQSLPKSDFALPGKGTGPKGAGSGSYPIPDRSHAANALARSSGKPVAAEVRAKVKAKYPDMGK
jgi:hypothetical protein